MPTIYANTNDSGVGSSYSIDGATGWDLVRNGAGTLTLIGGGGRLGETVHLTSIQNNNFRPTGWGCGRYFLEFDFTGVSNVASATLYLTRGLTLRSTQRGRLIKGPNQSPATTSFTSIPGFVQGSSMAGNVTDYSSDIITGGAVDTEVSFTLNTTCVNDANTGDILRLAVVEYDADYLNVSPIPGDQFEQVFYIVEEPGTTKDPRIEYTTSGGGNRVVQLSKTRGTLRESSLINLQLNQGTDYEFKCVNNSNSQVYFALKGANGKKIFSTSSIRTTTSDSGSNVTNLVAGSVNAALVLKANATSSFMVSSSTADILGNNIKAIATNPLVYNVNDPQASGSVFGVDMEIIG